MHDVVPRAALLSGQIQRQLATPNSESGWLHSSGDNSHTPALRSWTCLLPLDVQHLDLPEQKHTNALVMSHILQPENGVVLMEPAKTTTTTDAERLIALATSLEPYVQVILDVGAQILELDNLDVAKARLKMHGHGKEATIFVDDFDEICVVDRSGKIEMLRTSSYSNRLGDCPIFLDEAHTRGIDLQLPVHYRALVTLGPA